jgi:hypothetical protein
MGNNDAAAILGEGDPPGKFLIRKHTVAGEYVLTVTFKSKVTHHRIKPDESGNLTVNGKSYGTPATSLEELVPQLAADPPPAGWPVRLAQPFPAGSASAAAAPDSAGSESPPDGPEHIKNIKAWVHEAMSNTKSEALFTAAGKATVDGTFMVRRRGTEFPKGFVLSVVYKGKPSHHLIHVAPNASKINKATISTASNVNDVIAALRKKEKFWPVPLKGSILPDMEGEKKAAAAVAAAKAAAAAEAKASADATAAEAAAAKEAAAAQEAAAQEAATKAAAAAAAAPAVTAEEAPPPIPPHTTAPPAAPPAASVEPVVPAAAALEPVVLAGPIQHQLSGQIANAPPTNAPVSAAPVSAPIVETPALVVAEKGMTQFYDAEDGGTMGFDDSGDESGNAPPRQPTRSSGTAASKDADEILALEARIAAMKTKTTPQTPAAAPTAPPANKKKTHAEIMEEAGVAAPTKPRKKTHAQIMAELAGETAAEEEAEAAEAPSRALRIVGHKKKKTHAEMMAELAAEEPEPETCQSAPRNVVFDLKDRSAHDTGITAARQAAFGGSKSNGGSAQRVEPNWKKQLRINQEADAAEKAAVAKQTAHYAFIESDNARIKEEAKRALMLESRNLTVTAHLRNQKSVSAPKAAPIRRRNLTAEEEAVQQAAAEAAVLVINKPSEPGKPPQPPFEIFRTKEEGAVSTKTTTCPVCMKPDTGQVVAVPLGTFHKWCFKCAACREQLNKSTYATHDCREYCERCYNDLFELIKNKWVPLEYDA